MFSLFQEVESVRNIVLVFLNIWHLALVTMGTLFSVVHLIETSFFSSVCRNCQMMNEVFRLWNAVSDIMYEFGVPYPEGWTRNSYFTKKQKFVELLP